jgi:hypothetical protein
LIKWNGSLVYPEARCASNYRGLVLYASPPPIAPRKTTLQLPATIPPAALTPPTPSFSTPTLPLFAAPSTTPTDEAA